MIPHCSFTCPHCGAPGLVNMCRFQSFMRQGGAVQTGAKLCLCGDTQSGCPAHPRVDEEAQHG
jgi:hypothetical protein